MSLNNGMSGTTEGGVYLIKKYDYYTYNQTLLDCNCTDVTGNTTGYTSTGTYVLPYKNSNPNYSINTTDESICLTLVDKSMDTWFDLYINSLVTTGYTTGNTIEERVIYDGYSNSPTYNNFYKLTHTFNYTGTTDSFEAIIDPVSGLIWNGVGEYWVDEIDGCDALTGYEIVQTTDINPNSPTYNESKYVYRCHNNI